MYAIIMTHDAHFLFSLSLFWVCSFIAILAAQADRYHAVSAPFIYSQAHDAQQNPAGGFWVTGFIFFL